MNIVQKKTRFTDAIISVERFSIMGTLLLENIAMRWLVIWGFTLGLTLLFGSCKCSPDLMCPESASCKEEGLCTTKNDACIATSDEQCKRSTNCKKFGDCVAVNGFCTNAPDSILCKDSEGCRVSGYCTSSQGKCLAIAAQDCRASTMCLQRLRCTPSEGRCIVKDTQEPPPKTCQGAECPQTDAAPTEREGCRGDACEPSQNDICKADISCKTHGRCTFDPTSRECIPATDADCRQSEACTRDGRCGSFKRGGRAACVVRRASDCAAAEICKTNGSCALNTTHARENVCSPSSDAHCKNSELCTKDGRCGVFRNTFAGENICIAKTDDDCKNSDACKNYGECKVDKTTGACIK